MKERGVLRPTLRYWTTSRASFTCSVAQEPSPVGWVFLPVLSLPSRSAVPKKRRGRWNRRSGGSLVCFALGRRFSPEDRHLLRRPVVGCTSGVELPMPDPPASGMAWLSWLLTSIDVARFEQRRAPFDAGFGALQALVEALNAIKAQLLHHGLPFEDHGVAFVDLLDHIGSSTELTIKPREPTASTWSRPTTPSGAPPTWCCSSAWTLIHGRCAHRSRLGWTLRPNLNLGCSKPTVWFAGTPSSSPFAQRSPHGGRV